MPRRKRTTYQNDRQRKVRRTDNNEDTLVISDSENDEEEDCASKSSSRTARWRERGSKVQIQDMTEDEMLDLAMRLSKQEANTAAQRQQLEEDDMRKAIEESLHVSHSPEADPEPAIPVSKPHQDAHKVTGPLRRKLSFPSKNEMHSTNSGDAAGAMSGMQETSPLAPMPDLSQPSSLCPPVPSVPSTSSQQECASSQWKDEELDGDSPEDKPSQRDSQLQCSPAFLRQCSVRLGQNMLTASGNSHSTHDCSPDPTHPNSFQLDLPTSPVFTKADSKIATELSGNQDSDSFTDNVCSPNKKEENFQESLSHKNLLHESRDCQNRLSLCRKAQPLTRISVPDGNDVSLKQGALGPNQMKVDSMHGTSLHSVFERSTNSEEMLLPEETKSVKEFRSHMLLHLSDDDDDDEEEDEKVVNPSPVFHQESVSCARPPSISPTQPCCSLLATTTTSHALSHSSQESTSQDVRLPKKNIPKTIYPSESDQPEAPRKQGIQHTPACDSRLTEGTGSGLVSYYWGVPFCPRGQNPDDYTRVILSQLEVYEKSLKAAQRGLLRKVDWGLPVQVFPCPMDRSFGRRFKRHRAPRLLDEDDEDNNEEPEQQQQEEKKKAEQAGEERAESQTGSDVGARDGHGEPYVVVSSPETQEELTQKSTLLFGQQDSMDVFKPSSCTKPSPRDHSPIQHPNEYEDQHQQCDAESTVCPETQLTEDSTPELMVTSPVQPQSRADSEVMEVDEEGNPPTTDEDRMEQERSGEEQLREPRSPPSHTVACPMCCRLFTLNKIEMHAAYCDGAPEQQAPARRRRTGRIAMGEASPRSEKSEEQEKCYICHRFFSREEYTQHVHQCLQQKSLKPHQGNGLLAALDQTEKGHIDDYGAGPSDSTIRNNRGLADPSLMAEAGGSGSCSASNFCVSSSPIKSFTPISEATDCLIDFKHQYSARPSQRLGRKRKFKR